ncbi:MAG: prepilin-type N-terminal cleavage/methylation domain-containing protein [Rubrivivax sp.]
MIKPARQRGVSLLEALVAMAVMAVGAVAVVGLQATLRTNGDLAKQRAEAVRLAQEAIEGWRGYQALAATAGVTDWTDIQTVTTAGIAGVNATYTRDVTVVARGVADDDPLSNTVHVRVSWQDRTGQDQSIGLNTLLAGVHPELAGTLSAPQDNTISRLPGGRHPAIPRTAIDQGDGTSRFNPPNAGTQFWVFNNTTGVIIKLCSNAATCSDIRAYLLQGFVRFSTGMVQPTPAQAESPGSSPLSLTVTVDQEAPFSTGVGCFGQFESTFVEYFCLMQVTVVSPKWTGTTQLTGFNVSGSINDDHDDRYKVCRYTAVRSNSAVVPTNLKNADHPLRYVDVDSSLTNQNYLVIRAGNDTDPFVCPNDNAATANVNGATWYHQPSS